MSRGATPDRDLEFTVSNSHAAQSTGDAIGAWHTPRSTPHHAGNQLDNPGDRNLPPRPLPPPLRHPPWGSAPGADSRTSGGPRPAARSVPSRAARTHRDRPRVGTGLAVSRGHAAGRRAARRSRAASSAARRTSLRSLALPRTLARACAHQPAPAGRERAPHGSRAPESSRAAARASARGDARRGVDHAV